MHVAITGASSGIGEALAREYLAAGAQVTLVARRRQQLDAVAAAAAPGSTHVAVADLGDPERAGAWLAGAEAALGPIDVLVNNAGTDIVAPIESIPIERAEQLLRLNLFTPLRLIHAVLPSMRERRSGTIVNVASSAAHSHLRGMAYYSASKAGLAAASESLRAELAPTGVRVCTVYPGPVHTPLGDEAYASVERTFASRLAIWGTTDVLAHRVRHAVERGAPRVVYPRFYQIPRLFPELARLVTDRIAPAPRLPAPPPPAKQLGDRRS
jgi:short-subunit dehydrogenase